MRPRLVLFVRSIVLPALLTLPAAAQVKTVPAEAAAPLGQAAAGALGSQGGTAAIPVDVSAASLVLPAPLPGLAYPPSHAAPARTEGSSDLGAVDENEAVRTGAVVEEAPPVGPASAVHDPAVASAAAPAAPLGAQIGVAPRARTAWNRLSAGLRRNGRRLWNSVIDDPELGEERARRYLPGIHARNLDAWRERLGRLPEQANGLSTERAIELLSRLKGEKNPASGAEHVRNGTYFRHIEDGQYAVVKRVYRRSEMGESRVYSFSNDVRFEVLAFHLDRFLGTNLVPPALRLDGGTIAQLKIRGVPTSLDREARDPLNLMDLSHLRILDLLTGNVDRKFPGNLLSSAGKLVGIDFDLSYPDTMPHLGYLERRLRVEGVTLEPRELFWKRGPLPGVFSRAALERLARLDRETIRRLAAEGGIALKPSEVESVFAHAQGVLFVVRGWQEKYGPDLIVVD